MFPYRRLLGAVAILLLMSLLAACGGSNIPQAQKPTPTPSPTPISGQGTQLLKMTAQKIDTAKTLRGVFDAHITGLALNGTVESEIWNATPDKSRTLVLHSSLSRFPVGSVTVSNGKQTWQYNPGKKVVYSGPVTHAAAGGTIGSSVSAGQSQFILNLTQTVFTRSDAALLSSSAKIDGRDAYEVHVVPGEQTSTGGGESGGIGNFNYEGEVYIDKRTNLPLQLNLTISGFGRVVLDLPTLVLNAPVPDSIFTFIVPAGVKVLPLQQANATATTGSLTLAQAQQQAGYHLLSIPSAQAAYQLEGVNALGAPGSQVYTLNYTSGGASFTIAEGKPLANLPGGGGQQVSLRGTTGTLSTTNGFTTLAWTENGVGISITGPSNSSQLVAIAKILT